jgi:hypothetical protein
MGGVGGVWMADRREQRCVSGKRDVGEWTREMREDG